jgi:phosphoribosylamine---glycine ligase
MKVCVVGSGGREHALQFVLSRDAEVIVTPGNPGIPGSTQVPPEEIDADLYVIGPEAPLSDGLADRLRADGKLVFGPGADGAMLEGSKAWMKQLLVEAGVPTARHAAFTELEPAIQFLKELPGLYVVKTDGLAAGKGVFVTESIDEAIDDVRDKLSGSSFGAAGRRVVIEEGMTGNELSVLAVCDGRLAFPLTPARDHKRVGDGDIGPMTGGIGAFSPVAEADQDVQMEVLNRCIMPTLWALQRKGIDFRGVLYAGLMLTPEGPKIVEYNVRFGDPESQVVLPRLQGDLVQLLAEAAAGALHPGSIPETDEDAAVCVVMCAPGYPTDAATGGEITGLNDDGQLPGAIVFHAGTTKNDKGRWETASGRVLGVTAVRPTVEAARSAAYDAAGKIHWEGVHYRHDIGESA